MIESGSLELQFESGSLELQVDSLLSEPPGKLMHDSNLTNEIALILKLLRLIRDDKTEEKKI